MRCEIPYPHLVQSRDAPFDQPSWWGHALQVARARDVPVLARAG
jgi:hypothetical protein